MAEVDTTTYFRDLLDIGSDPSMSLGEKIARAIATGRERLDIPYGVLSYTGAGEYEIVDSSFSEGAYVAGSVHDLDATWCRYVVDDNELLAIADAGDSEFDDDIAREETNLECYIGAPILIDGETFGTLCYSGEIPRSSEFGDDEKQFVRLLTQWIGYEIERERHYQALDTQNEWVTEFADMLAHDLRNPLTAARGFTELVAESVSGENADHLQRALDNMDRMEVLITETLSLARKGGDVGERERLQLGEVARAAWETVSPTNATLALEDDRVVRADRSRLKQLFEKLFSNVDEHCGPDVTVTVRGTDDGFIVSDDGPGLPDAVVESLFGAGGDSDRVGLGLLIVERVVSGHGWHANVNASDGTEFVFSGIGAIKDISAVQ